jgi:hypothetical protein
MLEADIDYSNPQTDIEKVQFIATLESDLTNCIRKTPGASWDQTESLWSKSRFGGFLSHGVPEKNHPAIRLGFSHGNSHHPAIGHLHDYGNPRSAVPK